MSITHYDLYDHMNSFKHYNVTIDLKILKIEFFQQIKHFMINNS